MRRKTLSNGITDRYSIAADPSAEIGRHRADEAVTAHPEPPIARTRRWLGLRGDVGSLDARDLPAEAEPLRGRLVRKGCPTP